MTPEQATELLRIANENHAMLTQIMEVLPWIVGMLISIIIFK